MIFLQVINNVRQALEDTKTSSKGGMLKTV